MAAAAAGTGWVRPAVAAGVRPLAPAPAAAVRPLLARPLLAPLSLPHLPGAARAHGRGSGSGGRTPPGGRSGSGQDGAWQPGGDAGSAPQSASASSGGSPSNPGSARASPQPGGFLQSLPGMRRDTGGSTGTGGGSSAAGSSGSASTPLGASLAARLRAGATGSGGGGYGEYRGSSVGWGNGGWGTGSGAGGGGDAWTFRPTDHADGAPVAAWTIAALAPVAVWCLTWSLTTGLAHLADASMGGMCGVARALFPTLGIKGVAHEDVAVSLVKSMQAGTADDATWTRPGLWVPGWAMQGLMRLFLGLAVASTSIAASLGQAGPWMTACGVSQALLYALALLIALPVGAGLHSLMQRLERALGGSGDTGEPAAASKSSSPTPETSSSNASSSSTALTLKLAATLAWPCISASAVSGAIAARAIAAPPLGLATLKVAAAATTVALSLTIALATARYIREIGLGTAGDAAAADFGVQVGVLCGAQAAANLVQLGLGLFSGGLALREVAVALLSTAVLVRVVGTVWLLRGETRPSAWLQLLTLDTLLARKKAE